MKKKDLVDLFLRSKSITVLVLEEGLFDKLAKEVSATVASRFRYSNFSITPNRTLRSPYLGEQYFRYHDPSTLVDTYTSEVVIVYSNLTSLEALESFHASYTFARLEV